MFFFFLNHDHYYLLLGIINRKQFVWMLTIYIPIFIYFTEYFIFTMSQWLFLLLCIHYSCTILSKYLTILYVYYIYALKNINILRLRGWPVIYFAPSSMTHCHDSLVIHSDVIFYHIMTMFNIIGTYIILNYKSYFGTNIVNTILCYSP